nr:hypothetical protein [Tanacetum cinerariifolium]
MSDLDTMSLDDLYNHLKIDEDDMEEMDVKWNMALLSMRADRFRKKTGKKITIQGTDVAGFDKSKVECFNCHKMGKAQKLWSRLLTDCRNMSDLDTMSLDDLYNHLKVYEPEVQKKSESNSQNMAFISSAKHNNINQIDEDDMEEMDVKWNMALLSMRADRFWKKTRKKITIQGTDVAGFDKSKVECFNCHKMGHFARKCRASRSQDRGRRDNYRQGSKVEEQTPKALMEIDRVG